MNKYELYTKTADYFEQHPGHYDFMEVTVPPCGSPGCVIGIMGMIAGETGKVSDVCQKIIGMSETDFYTEMNRARRLLNSVNWCDCVAVAIACLRYLVTQEKILDIISRSDLIHDEIDERKRVMVNV